MVIPDAYIPLADSLPVSDPQCHRQTFAGGASSRTSSVMRRRRAFECRRGRAGRLIEQGEARFDRPRIWVVRRPSAAWYNDSVRGFR
jgi:hypothetical protein